jgi:hypothetical protein
MFDTPHEQNISQNVFCSDITQQQTYLICLKDDIYGGKGEIKTK